MIKEMKKSPETYPYPHKFNVTISVPDFIAQFDPLCKDNEFLEQTVSLAGRVTNIRSAGKSLVFYDLKSEGKRLQVMCNINNHKGQQAFAEVHSKFRRGDIIGVIGQPGRTKSGELSIAPGEIILLSPCLHMMPELHVGFKDQETRYRKRYLDLIMNEKTRDTFIIRSKVISFVRRYLTDLKFLEV